MLKSLTVRHEGKKVLLLAGGVLLAEMDWRKADEFTKALNRHARLAEEEEKANQVVADAALMLRSGAPFALSNRLDIMREAAKEAYWNRDLRRYLPMVKTKGVVYAPKITIDPPKAKP